MIRLPRTFFFALCLTLIVSACDASTKKPELKQNPSPKQRYDITMTIQDAPGPFDAVAGYVVYQVLNDVCVALQPGSGARLAPHIEIPIVLTRTGESYKGEFYADRMLDEDYYGLGICKWTLTIAGVKLKARTNTFRADFYGSLSKQMPSQPMTLYFLNSVYTDPSVQDFDHGATARRPDYAQFSVTITTKKDFQ
jgi:hypothetical protein